MSFEKEYWDANYSDPSSMDGIGNAKDHIKYIKAICALDLIDISSVIDLGCGLGVFFKAMLKEFVPYKACGIEPSKLAFKELKNKKLKPVDSTKLFLYNESLQDWCKRPESKRLHYDFGVCMSVLQYIPDEDLEFVIEKMSERIKYLYLTVPTDVELNRQISELEFYDKFAIRRPRKTYQKLLSKHFTFISSRLLESKSYFDEETTHFSDLLYRF